MMAGSWFFKAFPLRRLLARALHDESVRGLHDASRHTYLVFPRGDHAAERGNPCARFAVLANVSAFGLNSRTRLVQSVERSLRCQTQVRRTHISLHDEPNYGSWWEGWRVGVIREMRAGFLPSFTILGP